MEKCHCCNNGLLLLDNLAPCTAANVVIFLHLLDVNNALTSLSPCINNTTATLCFQAALMNFGLQQLRWSLLAHPCLPPSLCFNSSLKTVIISTVWPQLVQNKLRLYSNSAQHRCQDVFYQCCSFFFVYSHLARLATDSVPCVLQACCSKLSASKNLTLSFRTRGKFPAHSLHCSQLHLHQFMSY